MYIKVILSKYLKPNKWPKSGPLALNGVLLVALGSLFGITRQSLVMPGTDLSVRTPHSCQILHDILFEAGNAHFHPGLMFNPLVTDGLSHPYHLDESTLIFRGIRSNFSFFISYFDENRVSKQNNPRWDAAFATSHLGLFCAPILDLIF